MKNIVMRARNETSNYAIIMIGIYYTLEGFLIFVTNVIIKRNEREIVIFCY